METIEPSAPEPVPMADAWEVVECDKRQERTGRSVSAYMNIVKREWKKPQTRAVAAAVGVAGTALLVAATQQPLFLCFLTVRININKGRKA